MARQPNDLAHAATQPDNRRYSPDDEIDHPESEFERSFLNFLTTSSPIWTFHDTAPVQPEPNPSESSTGGSRFTRLTSLRSRLRHKKHHRAPKSSSSRTSFSSQPVLVRAYTGSRSREVSRARSIAASLDAMGASSNSPLAKLPPVDDFSFDGILRAVEPEIQSALDAIAEICARSRMSMASAHAAHMPPTGEIVTAVPPPPPQQQQQQPQMVGVGRVRHWGLGIRTDVERMTSVPEVSSSSGSVSKASSASGMGRKRSAIGSLKNIMAKSKDVNDGTVKEEMGSDKPKSSSWVVVEDNQHPSIVVVTQALASRKLSLEAAVEVPPSQARKSVAKATQQSTGSGSWIPWRHPSQQASPIVREAEEPRQSVENLLKGILQNRPPAAPG